MNRKYAKISIVIVFLYTIINIFFISTLKFEYDFESFFPEDDDDFEFFQEFTEKFENDNDWIVIGLKTEQKSIFNTDFITKLDSLTTDLKAITNVVKVQSPTTLKNVLISPGGILNPPFIHVDEPEKLAKDSSIIYQYKDLVNSFFSEDAKSVLVLLQFKNGLKKDSSTALYEQVDETIASYNFNEYHIAGRLKAEVEYVKRMQLELAVFVSASVVLIIIFLTISYRSVWGVVLPLFIVLISIVACLGFMGMMGKHIDIMTILLPTIMFVVGMSDVVHILSKYLEELRLKATKVEALNKTIKEIGMAIFLTSLTTAIGFLTLLTAGVKPIQEFGTYTAAGVFLAFILAITFMPAMMFFLKKPKIAESQKNRIFWHKSLGNLFIWTLRKRKAIIFASIALTGLSLVGISMIKIDARLIDEVNDGDPLKEDFLFFEDNFRGGRPFEFAAWVVDSSKTAFNYEVMQQFNLIQEYLEQEFEVGQMVSPVTMIKTLNRARNGGIPEYYTMPDKRTYRELRRPIKTIRKSKEFQLIVTEDLKTVRFSGKMNDIGSLAMEERTNQLYDYLKANVDSKLIAYRMTGSPTLIDKSNRHLSQNMMEGLAIAFIAISIIMGFLFKSPRAIIVSLVPNILPLLIIAGIIGYFNVGLKMSTSIIFTIAFGIAVDDTIHFMSKLRIELGKGKSLLYALKRTFISTGKAIIVTSVILSGGFLTLIFSAFNGTYYTGLLISLTLVFAVISDLLLIPSLIVYLYPSAQKSLTSKKNKPK